MLSRICLIAASLILAVPVEAQEVISSQAPPPSCSAGKLDVDVTAFLGPEDLDAASSQTMAVVANGPGAIVGSLPERAVRHRIGH